MHAVNISDETWIALERIRSARGLRSITAAVVAVAAEADPGRVPPPECPPPPYGAVLDAWAEICGPEPRTLRDVMAAPEAAKRLTEALREAGLLWRLNATRHDVGFVFRSLRGRVDSRGRRLEAVADRSGVARWYVRGPEDGPRAADGVGDGQAPGQAAAGAVTGP